MFCGLNICPVFVETSEADVSRDLGRCSDGFPCGRGGLMGRGDVKSTEGDEGRIVKYHLCAPGVISLGPEGERQRVGGWKQLVLRVGIGYSTLVCSYL